MNGKKKEERRVPKLRFPGFTEDWEQRKLGEVANVNSGRDYKHLSEGNIPVYGTGGYMLSVNEALSYTEDAIGIGRKGTIDRPYILKAPFWTVDTLFYVINMDNVDLKYLYGIFQRIDWKSKDESTGVPSLSKSIINKIYINIPEMNEQIEIGLYLDKVDNIITLHQRKLENLKEMKKGLLQKMFPKNNEKVPELRFPGFTEDWEQRKLNELFVERNNQCTVDEEYPLMAFIANIGVAPKGDRYDRSALVNDEKAKKYKRTESGDFIYSSNNLETGSIGLNNYGKASISPVYSIFKAKSEIDSDFMGRILLRREFINKMIKYRQGVVYGQWRIHEDDFLNLYVKVPDEEEQNTVGILFRNLDNLITLHQRKLDNLKELKKGLLQQMFV